MAVIDTGAVEELQEVLLDCAPQQNATGYRINQQQAGFVEATLAQHGNWKVQAPTAWRDRPASELTLQALSGGPALRGSRAWPPVSAGGQHGEYMAGVFAAVATHIGLRRRVLTGEGGVIDLSALESVIMTQLFNPITMETAIGGVRPRRAKATVGDVLASKDG